jgi:prepilin-type N-terminal cleavage/methylation domain-containing protein
MKEAFTMIELIFVIVIIGILASVAIPKLVATRDDAKVSSVAMNTTVVANDIAAYAVSQGTTENLFRDMSPTAGSMIDNGKATQSGSVFNIKMNTVNDCLILSIISSSNDKNLTLTYGSALGDQLCISLQGIVDSHVYPIPLKGSVVQH